MILSCSFFPFFRSYAISCVNQFIFNQSSSLVAHIDAFLRSLFTVSADEDLDVRKNVCRALVMLLEVRTADLLPHMHSIIEVRNGIKITCYVPSLLFRLLHSLFCLVTSLPSSVHILTLLVHLLTHHPLICQSTCLPAHSCTYSHLHFKQMHSLTHLATHSLTHSPTHSPTHSLTHTLTHSLTHYFTRTLSHSLTFLSFSQYMLIHTGDSNENVAIEACEFWLTLAEQKSVCQEALSPHLNRYVLSIVTDNVCCDNYHNGCVDC